MDSLSPNEYRCQCGKLLLKGTILNGFLEIKCKRCGIINKIGNLKHKKDSSRYLLILNNEGIIINSNDVANTILGYTKEELNGKELSFINPTFPKEIFDRFFGKDSVLNEENYFELEIVHRNKQGQNILVTSSLKLFKPSDKEKYILISSVNKKDVVENRTLFDDNDFIKNSCDFYFDIDKNGIGEFVSPTIGQVLGFKMEDMLGKKYFDFIPNEIKERDIKIFEHFSAKGLPYRIVHDDIVAAKGNKIGCELYFTSKFNSSGSFMGYRVLGWRNKHTKA